MEKINMTKIMEVIKEKKMITRVIGIVVGAILGFAYYKIVGCRSGACPITSNPYISIIWGGLMGFLFTG